MSVLLFDCNREEIHFVILLGLWPKLEKLSEQKKMRPIWHTANWATKIAASIPIVSTSPAVSDKQLAATPISGSRPIFTIQPTPKCARVPSEFVLQCTVHLTTRHLLFAMSKIALDRRFKVWIGQKGPSKPGRRWAEDLMTNVVMFAR
jgi:hypothetical protein